MSVQQVGGDHYSATYQHWDWATDTALGYLEGSATKYVSRWWKKGGKQDLEKGLSFIYKLQAAAQVPDFPDAFHRPLRSLPLLQRFKAAAQLNTTEDDIITLIDGWTRENGALDMAAQLTRLLISNGQRNPFGYDGEG